MHMHTDTDMDMDMDMDIGMGMGMGMDMDVCQSNMRAQSQRHAESRRQPPARDLQRQGCGSPPPIYSITRKKFCGVS